MAASSGIDHHHRHRHRIEASDRFATVRVMAGWWATPHSGCRRASRMRRCRVARSSLPGGDNGQVTVDLSDSRIADVCRRYGVAELSVFGSVARGDDTACSDIDLLYVLAPDSTLGFDLVDL